MATQLRDLDIDLITRGHLERGIDGIRASRRSHAHGDLQRIHGVVPLLNHAKVTEKGRIATYEGTLFRAEDLVLS